MGELRLYNTMTRKSERFEPRRRGRVRLFTCGPSVYRRQHLGNYRTFLFEDVLLKYLEHSGLGVERVINFTDVEDKAIEEASRKGVGLEELRRPVEQAFFEECGVLGIRLPAEIPRATTSVGAAADLIRRLLDRGHAYRHGGEIFFAPLTYDGFGRLYRLDMRRWPEKTVRFRRDTYRGKRWNRGDFILWHKPGEAPAEVSWETGIGRGRPAWNIQDAAMIKKHLGFEIDIHTGGVDNLYRHHDYTLAVMEGASGKTFCPFWLHGGHLLVDGRKMSKSRGNVTYVGDLLQQGFRPRHIRFFLLCGPYREDLDLRTSRLEEFAGRLDRIRRLAAALVEGLGKKPSRRRQGADPGQALLADFEKAMDADLDYASAFDAVAGHLVRAAQKEKKNGGMTPASRERLRRALAEADAVLGVLGYSGNGGRQRRSR